MKYGFIGCGNMGSALATALSYATNNMVLADNDIQKAEALAKKLGCNTASNTQIASECDCIFLGVKPQVLASVVESIRVGLTVKKPLLITMAAGVEIAAVEKMAGGKLPVIRIMPNTPVSVGKGVVLYCRNELVDDAMLADFVNDMRYAGMLDAIDEKMIDAGCSISGCGPAFMYMYIEALADGAVACGLPRDKAIKYAAATMLGAAQLVLSSEQHPEALKDAVCSPGGSTIMGVKALEDGGLRAASMNAVIAAFERNKELGK